MKQYERISQYRVMWIFVLFDLPTETQKDIKAYAQFRKNIMRDGFTMFQFSIYIRQCSSIENVEAHIKRVKSFMPNFGKIGILTLTDKQFEKMELFLDASRKKSKHLTFNLKCSKLKSSLLILTERTFLLFFIFTTSFTMHSLSIFYSIHTVFA